VTGNGPRSARRSSNVLGRGVVPYITSWTGERPTHRSQVVARRGVGIGYADEGLYDRDEHGVLWERTVINPGKGQPEFGLVHAARQRWVMRKLLCQVCAGPADRTEQGVLWLLGDDLDKWPNWPENMGATHPPVCLPCARKSFLLCPYLRDNYVAVRVKEPKVSGVYGVLYRRGPVAPVPMSEATMEYGDPRICWMLAAQLVTGLYSCTFVDVEAEARARAKAV
jgi:hypothetical protein